MYFTNFALRAKSCVFKVKVNDQKQTFFANE